jgi:hypothetical protein
MPLAGTFRCAFRMSRLRLHGQRNLGLIDVEKQPVFVCSSAHGSALSGSWHMLGMGLACRLRVRVKRLLASDHGKGDMQQEAQHRHSERLSSACRWLVSGRRRV